MDTGSTFKYRKVMIIDDSEIDRYIGRQIIKISFFAEEVVMEDSARDALATLGSMTQADEVPEVILLDISMPEMDGFAFLEKYKELPDVIRNNSGVVMISSTADTNDRYKAANNEYVKYFISKPLDKEKLEKYFNAMQQK